MTFDMPDRHMAVGLGIVGLGRAFMLTLPSIQHDIRLRLVAAFDPRTEARNKFQTDFNGIAYDSLEGCLNDPMVEVVYIASPHQMHMDHAIAAMKAGKHVLIEKPIAIEMEDSRKIIAAAETYDRLTAIGPCHSFDPQIAECLEIIKQQIYGQLRMINANYYTDFMYRPRRPEELKTKDGGGVIFSQAAHQVDIIRLLAGGLTKRVTALTGEWDKNRPSEGAYSALMQFESGITASLTYSGYAHYNTDEQFGWMSEIGHRKNADDYGAARRNLKSATITKSEAQLKDERTFGKGNLPPATIGNEHFGELVLSFDEADIYVSPTNLTIYGNDNIDHVEIPVQAATRINVMDAIWYMARSGISPIQNARWGHATLEACHGIFNSAAKENWQVMTEQVAVPNYPNKK